MRIDGGDKVAPHGCLWGFLRLDSFAKPPKLDFTDSLSRGAFMSDNEDHSRWMAAGEDTSLSIEKTSPIPRHPALCPSRGCR
jgi:hypothetical protein